MQYAYTNTVWLGYKLTGHHLQDPQIKINLRHYVCESEVLADSNKTLEEVLQNWLDSWIAIHYGRELMYTHVRKMNIPVARDHIFKIMHKINAEGINTRHKEQIIH